ncbi:MAG: hypothetical protein ACUVQX_06820 [Candidatus Bathycorpusculaceae bacterium]
MTSEEKVTEDASVNLNRQQKFLMLVIIGFFIIFVGIIILIIAALVYGEGSANFVGIISIWFIPLVFGFGPESEWIVMFAIIIAVLSILMFLILRREIKKEKG